MSNQDFDTSNTFSSASQPVPIAKQLNALPYLAQIQDKRKDIAFENSDAPPIEFTERIPAPPAAATEAPKRENKMDAFFRQVEEERHREKMEALNLAPSVPSSDLPSDQETMGGDAEIESPQDISSIAPSPSPLTPVSPLPAAPVETSELSNETSELSNASAEAGGTLNPPAEASLPEIEMPTEKPSEMINRSDSEIDAPFVPTNSPFSVANFGQPPKFTPSPDVTSSQEVPQVEEVSALQEVSPFQAIENVAGQNADEQARIESDHELDVSDLSGTVSGSMPVVALDSSNANDLAGVEQSAEPHEVSSQDVQDQPTDSNQPRRLTGAAGLSAAIAAAGMGALGATLAGQQTEGQSFRPVPPPETHDSGATFGRDVQGTPDSGVPGGTLTGFAGQPFSPQSTPTRATEPDSSAAEAVSHHSVEDPSEQPPMPQSFGPLGDLDVSQFQPIEPDESQSPVQPHQQFQDIGSDPFAVPQSEPPLNEPVHQDPVHQDPATVSENPLDPTQSPTGQANGEDDQNDDSDVDLDSDVDVDARQAAMQQAEKIKAERARELARANDNPPPARPFGVSPVQEGEDTGLSKSAEVDPNTIAALNRLVPSPQTQTASSDAGVVQSTDAPAVEPSPSQVDGNPGLIQPQRRQSDLSEFVESAASDAAQQRRSFPMELFNSQLLRNLRSGVVFVDHQRRVQMWSKSAELMTGIVSEAVLDRPLYPQTFNLRFEDGTGVKLEQCPITLCLETLQISKADYRILNAANQEIKIEITVVPVIDEQRYVNGAIIIFDDHSAEIDLQRQLKDLYEFSVLDPLTQVANRAEFERVLEEYVRAFNSSDHFNCSIIICDIDYFKSINDCFGHAVGDQALVAFAEMLRNYVRSQDLVARYGGEEFVILCADCDTDSALQRAEQIRMALFKTQQPMLDGKAISASFGVSELRRGDTAMEFFVRADTALLKAKELGRNRVVIADQREAVREVGVGSEASVSGVKWRQQRREHTALLCEEFKTSTLVTVLVEKLRGFIVEKDAWLQRVDQEFLSMEVDFEDPNDYSRKGSFTMNIEFKEGEDEVNGQKTRKTFIRVTIFPGRKKKWFSTNHTDVAPHLLGELRSYLMINDEASHLSIKMATKNVRG
jgi:diguanylate cyclase (GGDEF)-like protein